MKQQPSTSEETNDAPGALLSEARLALGLSVQQIASRMNLDVDVVQKIESDNYQQSLSPAFYRGYLRAYAQIVDCDADELIKLYNRCIKQGSLDTAITATFETDLYTQTQRKLPLLKWFLISSLVVVLSIVGYFLLTLNFTKNEALQTQIPLLTDDIVVTSKSAEAVVLEQIMLDEVELDKETIITDVNAKIVMNFSGDCWVKVTDSSGEVLALGIKRAGKLMQLEGLEPFNIILGNSAAVVINYNDRVVDLSSFPTGNRVEFTLSAHSGYLQ